MMPKRAFVKILQSILQKRLTQWSIVPMVIFSRCLCKVHCRYSGCFIFFLVYIILIYVIQIYNLCKVHCRYGSHSSHNLSHRCNGLPRVCKGGQRCTWGIYIIISFGVMHKKLVIDANVINRLANLGSQQSSSASHNPPGDRYFIQLEV